VRRRTPVPVRHTGRGDRVLQAAFDSFALVTVSAASPSGAEGPDRRGRSAARGRLRTRQGTVLDRAIISDPPIIRTGSHASRAIRRAAERAARRRDGAALVRRRDTPGRGRVASSAVAAQVAREVATRKVVLELRGVSKRFGSTVAVDGVEMEVREGSLFGVVGPNGAGKTTTLSMITGLLRPDAGTITVGDTDVWRDPEAAKRAIGVLPDRLRLFDRLTGAQLLYYAGVLRGLTPATVRERAAELAAAFGLEDALDRLVVDYSAGMAKKVALAAAMIHAPRVLVLDEPFESLDPVSAANVTEILQKYVASGGAVLVSSHSMDLIQRICDHVAIIVAGKVIVAGSVEKVRGDRTLEERFVELAGGRQSAEGMEWLQPSSV